MEVYRASVPVRLIEEQEFRDLGIPNLIGRAHQMDGDHSAKS